MNERRRILYASEPSLNVTEFRRVLAPLVESKRLGGHADLLGGFGSVQELGGRPHDSPRCGLTALLSGRPQGPGKSARPVVDKSCAHLLAHPCRDAAYGDGKV